MVMLQIDPSDKDNHLLRYLIQFAVPALILLAVIFAVSRRRQHSHGEHEDSAAVFLTIIVIGAVVAVATLFVLQVNWNSL
jgi:Zn-dependent protease with chaperone function